MENLAARLSREDVWALCERRCRRYLMGDASSMRAELAQEIFEGVAYLIELGLSAGAAGDASALYTAGEIENDRLFEAAKRLLEALCLRAPAVSNRAYRDTLKGLALAARRYNPQFFAHDPACLVDYPLGLPVADGRGARYLREYLARLTIETDFTDRFGRADALRALAPFDDELPVNLFEPVLIASLCRALPDGPREALAEEKALRTLAEHSEAEWERALALLPGGARTRAYCVSYARGELWPRLRAAQK